MHILIENPVSVKQVFYILKVTTHPSVIDPLPTSPLPKKPSGI